MNKKTFCMLFFFFTVSLFLNAVETNGMKAALFPGVKYKNLENSRIDNFNWEIQTTPKELTNTYYDYMPGSYCSFPVRVQGDETGEGVYLVYQAKENSNSQRRIFYSYIYPNDDITTSLLTASNVREGYPAMDIDPDTGSPVYTWHAEMDDDGIYEVGLCLDLFYIMGQPGLISTPYNLWETTHEYNEYTSPYVFVGPSPSEGFRRVYVYGNNAENNPSGYPSESLYLAYADFTDPADLSVFNSEQWTFTTIEELNELNSGSVKVFKAMAVGDEGQIAFIGHTSDLADDAPAYGPNNNIFIVENRNYGEGEWHTHLFDPTISVENPDDYFEGENGPYTDMRYIPYFSGHHNAIYTDEGDICFQAFYALTTEDKTWFPTMSTTKLIKYMPANNPEEDGELDIIDIYPQAENAVDEHYLPWSNPPEYDDGVLIAEASWPCYWYEPGDVAREQYFKLTESGGYMVSIYSDGTKSMLYNLENDQEYSEWEDVPEIFIQIGGGYGDYWSEPIKLNSIDTPELEGQIPSYPYIGDEIEDLGDGSHRLHLMYLDDNSYGSSILENGEAPDGDAALNYMSIDFWQIYFQSLDINDGLNKNSQEHLKLSNYPNPFNPSTEIRYSIPTGGQVEVTVHNIKGQKVKTLIDENQARGNHSIKWNGKDDSGNEIASGIYFCKIRHKEKTKINKLLMLK